jgi:hypothetical protein
VALSLEECFVSGHRLSLVEALMARWSSSLKQTVVMVYACSYELKPAESTHTQVNTEVIGGRMGRSRGRIGIISDMKLPKYVERG